MTKKSTAVSTTVQSDEERIKELETQLAELRNKSGDVEIKQTDYVRVMNLFPGHLNLNTQEQGRGKNFRFETFGEIKRILYSDLANILEVNLRFANSGYFIILDPRVIRVHGLEEAYTKILTKENIEKIISGSKDADTVYASSNEAQQRLVVTMLIERLRDNPNSVDLNVVDRISRMANVDIVKKAQEAREYFASKNPEENEGAETPK